MLRVSAGDTFVLGCHRPRLSFLCPCGRLSVPLSWLGPWCCDGSQRWAVNATAGLESLLPLCYEVKSRWAARAGAGVHWARPLAEAPVASARLKRAFSCLACGCEASDQAVGSEAPYQRALPLGLERPRSRQSGSCAQSGSPRLLCFAPAP